MADKSETIRIAGLTEFRKELAKLDESTFTNELKAAHKAVGELVVERAKSGAAFPVQRKAAGSLSSSSAASRAQISYGGSAFPFAMGAEFGSNRFRQFPPHRGREGYFLYPAVRESRDEAMRIYMDAVDKIVHDAFPD